MRACLAGPFHDKCMSVHTYTSHGDSLTKILVYYQSRDVLTVGLLLANFSQIRSYIGIVLLI